MSEPTLAEMREAVKWAEHVAWRARNYWRQYSDVRAKELHVRRDALRAVLRLLQEMEDDGR